MKKILSVMLLTALVLGLCCPAPAETAAPEKHTTADGYVYILKEDGSAEITGYTGSEKALAVPAQLDGVPVTSIGTRAFYSNNLLTEVVIPDSVKSLGTQCFGWCEKLQSVSLPEGLESIQYIAFFYCKRLKSINLPDSLKEIAEGPFAGCDALKEVSLSPDHPLLEMADGVLFRKDTRTLLWYPVSRKGNDYAVPEGTKRIGRYSLYHAKTESIILPDSVEELPEGAFDSCTRLRIVNIPPKVSTANRIFNACDKLEFISVDEGNESLEAIDGVLFDKTTRTLLKYPVGKRGKEYTVPEGTEAVAGNAFESTLLETVVLPGSVRVIGSYTFFLCLRLKEIALPEGTEELDDYAFQTCERLVKVSLPESLSKVGTNPFLKCKKLAGIDLAQGNQALSLVGGCLVRKEDMAVISCPPGMKEKKLEFPAGIRKIDTLAFDSCAGIEEIVFGDGLEEIADRAFRNCKKLKRVVLPASLKDIDPSAFNAGDLKKTVFVVTPGSYAESFCAANGLKTEYAE